MKTIDARGLACPAPVLQTKAALESEHIQNLKVVVDNAASQQNVQRFLESQGFQTTIEQSEAGFLVIGSGASEPLPAKKPVAVKKAEDKKIVVMCTSDRIGSGDDELGLKLMINFLRTLKEMDDDLWRLIFVNNGVKLTTSGSKVLDELKGYQESGLKIMVCGTCLDHFKLLDKKQVGETTNMLDIVTAMQVADKVINI